MPPSIYTDAAQGEAIAQEFEDQYIYVSGLGWHRWDGRRWAAVVDDAPLGAVIAWTKRRVAAAAQGYADGTVLRAELKAWLERENMSRLVACLKAARTHLLVPADQLDRRPDVLNCANGTVYLPTGDLMEHNPRDLLTKVAGCAYVATALHQDWNAALSAVPAEVEPWLQVRYGQGATGYMTPDDRVLIQQGGGANGKSTILTGVACALGDYFMLASDKILMSSTTGAHTTDLADLRGTRFVAIEETPEAGRLDVVRLKKVAGTERITARKLYMDNFTFTASHTLFVNTNYPPVVAETDAGTWRRLLLVNFPYTFTSEPMSETDRSGDPGLRERLRAGLDGQHEAVLAWLVEGAVAWFAAQRVIPAPPAVVERDTADWQGRTDHVGSFWSDHLDPDPEHFIYAGDLIWMFNNYLRQNGNAPVAESTFVRRFSTHPVTAGAIVRKTRVKQGARQSLKQSRPYGALDPFSRLPGVPTGQVWAWVGVRFRSSTDQITEDERQDHTKGRDV